MTNPSIRTSWQRHEVKYFIDEALALRIRRYCVQNLRLDRNCQPFADRQYPIHSVYLDSPDLQLARNVEAGEPDRFKLRVRTYRHALQADQGLPAFFEIKRKVMGIIYKQRSIVDRADAVRLLRNGANSHCPGTVTETEANDKLAKFQWLRYQLRATPKVAVFYTREAYEQDAGKGVRLSFDRRLSFQPVDSNQVSDPGAWWPVPIRGVIFEVKFTDTYPVWLKNLLASSDLVRRGVCKYTLCLQAARGVSLDMKETRIA
ncbi:MAG: polyphosphate polymerase domain-containing protein [Planctomycetia bacterium]|jgi:hypothetical protein|nr:polyphosphate polymerase domain-containing protein [Planctomycetia bacterium]MCC7314792.1 polyphosphate polymerase domain-containing protein [Planctomycetota bacterium]OQZ00037.1 MAG: hypothetical protein B6D36_15605 [Planctomycetes bacterium UTPLA1]